MRVEEVKAVSPKYFAELRNLLRMACNHAQRYSEQFGAIGYHPGEYRPLRTWTTKPKFEAPTKSDFEAAITAAQELGFVEMVPLLTLIRYSFRPSEAVALKWEDWDENLHGFHIRRTRQRTAGGETVEAIGKTTASLDFMPLPKTLKVLVFTTKIDGLPRVLPMNAGRKSLPRLVSLNSRCTHSSMVESVTFYRLE